MDRKHRGAASQLTAMAWLLEQGYEVFPNCSAHGPVDIIGRKDGFISLFDVKTRDPNLQPKRYRNGAQSLSAEQLEQNVKLLLVDRGGTCTITT